jgi:hypothetical protein
MYTKITGQTHPLPSSEVVPCDPKPSNSAGACAGATEEPGGIEELVGIEISVGFVPIGYWGP